MLYIKIRKSDNAIIGVNRVTESPLENASFFELVSEEDAILFSPHWTKIKWIYENGSFINTNLEMVWE